jgi:hypothetical protein
VRKKVEKIGEKKDGEEKKEKGKKVWRAETSTLHALK